MTFFSNDPLITFCAALFALGAFCCAVFGQYDHRPLQRLIFRSSAVGLIGLICLFERAATVWWDIGSVLCVVIIVMMIWSYLKRWVKGHV